MATKRTDASAADRKASFTVTQAAKAFRKARNGGAKVELVESDTRHVRRDHSGRFVLVEKKSPARKSDSRVLTGSARKR